VTRARIAVLAVLIATGVSLQSGGPAAARAAAVAPVAELNIPKAACGVAGVVNKAVGIACGVASNGGALIKSGKQLVTGHVGGAVSTLLGGGGSVASTASTALGIAAIGVAVVASAAAVLHEAAAALGATTTPQLQSTWFSSTYWRMAAIAALLTLPFLFAATVQAALRSDVALLTRAAFGYLPLAILSIAIAAPVTTMLLAASDELCAFISAAAGHESAHFIAYAGAVLTGLTALARSPFLAFFIGLFAVGAGFALWIELLLREAAVYVVVLMLPLAFAALAWPARRIWAIRAVELLVALILSKFAIVAVLSLGGAAISAAPSDHSVTGAMAGTVLVMLAAMSPWALLRLIPLTEIATGAAGAFRGERRSAREPASKAAGYAESGADWVGVTTASMRRDAQYRMSPMDDPPRPTGGEEPPQPGSDGPPDDAPSPPDPQPPPSREVPWSEQSAVELGPDIVNARLWPHEEADER
jgi:hypothetical protein